MAKLHLPRMLRNRLPKASKKTPLYAVLRKMKKDEEEELKASSPTRSSSFSIKAFFFPASTTTQEEVVIEVQEDEITREDDAISIAPSEMDVQVEEEDIDGVEENNEEEEVPAAEERSMRSRYTEFISELKTMYFKFMNRNKIAPCDCEQGIFIDDENPSNCLSKK